MVSLYTLRNVKPGNEKRDTGYGIRDILGLNENFLQFFFI